MPLVRGWPLISELFVKYGDLTWAWTDAVPWPIVEQGGVELEVDVSGYQWFSSLRFQYEGVDAQLQKCPASI